MYISMLCLRSARFNFDSLAVPVSLTLRRPRSSPRSLHFSSLSSNATPTRRPFSIKAHHHDDLFNYTSGRWIFNDALRHEERRRVFNVDGLRRLAAKSVHRSPDDIVDLKKLVEGKLNRTFLITMRGGFKMVARIPYPVTVPKYLSVASEVATMALLRSSGLPIPKVYGYSPVPDNAAETEYIFMEFVKGTELSNRWSNLEERDIISITRQLAQFESKMMSIVFPAGGSLYYAKDLEKLTGKSGIPLEDERFCIGPDTRTHLWLGKRSQLDVDRGPYESAEAMFLRGAVKERAYLEQFGRPLLPFHRERRVIYKHQKQLPSDHIKLLDQYLKIAPHLVPKDPALSHFRIRHPDLEPNNIIVARSPDSNLHIVGLVDWQHTPILPLFLLSGLPAHLQKYNDMNWDGESTTKPLLPENLVYMDETELNFEMEFYRRSLVHYHYFKNTEAYNKLHYATLKDTVAMFRPYLFYSASDQWAGDNINLKVGLIEATMNWKALSDTPCPVVFDPDDVRKTLEMGEEQAKIDTTLEICSDMIGCQPDGWVPVEHYEEAVACSRHMKEAVSLNAKTTSESEKKESVQAADWPFDDMDEKEYM